MEWYEIKTPRGYAADEVISALQKEIRRGHPLEAAYWANELYHTQREEDKDPKEKCWERLLVTAVEDIGPALPQAVLVTYGTWKDINEGFIYLDKEFESERSRFLGTPDKQEILLLNRGYHPILKYSILRRNSAEITNVREKYKRLEEKIVPYSVDNLAVCGLAYLLAKFPKDRIIDEIYNLTKHSLEKLGDKPYLNREYFRGRKSKEYVKRLLTAKYKNGKQLYSNARIYEDILYFMKEFEEEFWPTLDYILERHRIYEFSEAGELNFGWKMQVQPFFWTLQETYFMMPKGSGDRYMRGIFAVYSILNPEIFVHRRINLNIPFEKICEFIKDENLEVPDYALDKHTERGKQKGRGDLHFWTEGCKIENCSPYRDDSAYKALLNRLKTSKK